MPPPLPVDPPPFSEQHSHDLIVVRHDSVFSATQSDVTNLTDLLSQYKADEKEPSLTSSQRRDGILPLPIFTHGDLDAFLFVASNNLATLLSALVACKQIGLDDTILYQNVVQGFGVAMVVGNLYYWCQGNLKAEVSI